MKFFLSFLFVVCAYNMSQAQQNVGIGTNTPDPSAQLDVTSITKGFLAPRMNTTQRNAIASPATGLMVYDTTTGGYWVYNGISWVSMAAASTSLWTLNGTNIYNSNTGNVGIGTITPLSKFHVAGNMLMDATNATLQLQTGGVDKGFMQLSGDNLRIGTNSSNSLAKMIIRTGGSDRVFVDSIGQVGIGRSSPQFDLDINGNARIQTTSITGKSTLSLYANPNNQFDVYGTAGLTFFNWASLGGGNYDYNAKFKMDMLGGATERLKLYHVDYDNQLVLSNTGNVGINSNAPSEKLHIVGNAQIENVLPLLKLKKTSPLIAGEFGIEFNSSTNANLARISQVNSGLGFAASGSSSYPVFLKSNGYLGLGTQDPQERLHVAGNTILTGNNPTLQLQQFDVDKGFVQLSTNDIRIGTNSSNSTGKFIIRTNNVDQVYVGPDGNMNLTSGPGAGLTSNGYLMLGSQTGTNVILDNNEIMARNNGSTTPLTLQRSGGAVRIGATTVPAGYILGITGKVICEELKVKLAANWPDYVFNKNYDLLPLTELKKFIEENNHLPNIPKASVIEKEGMEVGDMQKKLMQKVEELTLYILDLQKQIDELKTKSANK